MSRRWIFTHALLPAALLVLALALIARFGLDTRLAEALFFNSQQGTWMGSHRWWAESLIHHGGRDAVRAIAACAVLVLAASFIFKRWQSFRRDAAFVALSIILSVGLVGLLKQATNVDCPWHLARYGGDRPYVQLFAPRPQNLPRAACFPGAHSGSGFSLACFYFLLLQRSRRAARMALAAAALLGALFAFGQEARGAHFVSHDLTSAALVWYVILVTYLAVLAPRRNTVRLVPALGAVSPR